MDQKLDRMQSSGRQYHLDWLRTLASYFVIVYHVAQFFDYQKKTYIKNAELSWVLDIFTRFVYLWHMPLFFLLAGWAAKRSLDSRGVWRFLLERVTKLFIPLLFGLFLWCAPPRWMEMRNGLLRTSKGEPVPAQPDMSFTEFSKNHYYTEDGIITWGHLWFLAYLFTFSVLYLPGFLVISRLDISKDWLEGWFGWTLANSPVVAVVAIEVTLRESWPGFQNLTDDWANFCSYSTFFWVGFCFARYPTLERHVYTSRKTILAIGSLSTLKHLLPFLIPGTELGSGHFNRIWPALAGWYTVLFLFSSAKQMFSDVQPPWFWTKRAFPIYVLHDVPLCLIADYLLKFSSLPIPFKFFSVIVSDLILTLLLHGSVLFLFGWGGTKKTKKLR